MLEFLLFSYAQYDVDGSWFFLVAMLIRFSCGSSIYQKNHLSHPPQSQDKTRKSNNTNEYDLKWLIQMQETYFAECLLN